MKSQPTPAAEAAPAPEELQALTTLKTLREGEFIQDLDDKLQDAINAATELGKPAKLTITLDVIPAGRTVGVVGEINPKLPKPAAEATMFFLGAFNKLTRKDPKQATFPAVAGFAGNAAPAING